MSSKKITIKELYERIVEVEVKTEMLFKVKSETLKEVRYFAILGTVLIIMDILISYLLWQKVPLH